MHHCCRVAEALRVVSRSAVTERILNYIGLYRRQCFTELGEAEFGISIEVEPPHDRRELVLDRLVADSLEEATNRQLVNHPMVLIVYRLEGPPDTETVELFQVCFELLKTELEVNLFR